MYFYIFLFYPYFYHFLFWFLVSKTEKNTLDKYIDNSSQSIDTLLTNINNYGKISKEEWQKIRNYAELQNKKFQYPNYDYTKFNYKLLFANISLVVIIFFIFILLVFVIKFGLKINFNLKHIIGENLLIFFFVGIIEVSFFFFIVSTYHSVMPDQFGLTIIDSIKKRINSSGHFI